MLKTVNFQDRFKTIKIQFLEEFAEKPKIAISGGQGRLPPNHNKKNDQDTKP